MSVNLIETRDGKLFYVDPDTYDRNKIIVDIHENVFSLSELNKYKRR